MPNDLRDRNFTPYKPNPAPKGAQSQNPGCGFMLLGWFLLMVGMGFMSAGIGIGGGFLTIGGVLLIARGFGTLWKAKKGTSKPIQRTIQNTPQRPAPKPAAKPVKRPAKPKSEACPNPEPHRHYETAPQRKTYDTFVEQNKKWPTATERLLENMKNLYDAGLLTKEEYDDEVRKLKG